MTDPELRYQAMLARLKARGCRNTSHRLALLRLLSVSEGHPTAMQLYQRLKAQFPTVSLSTIYKTLVLLKEDGEVLEIDLHGDSRYDGNKPFPHPHLICTACGRILDGDGLAALDNLDQQIAEKFGFRVQRQQQLFYGLCADCRSDSG